MKRSGLVAARALVAGAAAGSEAILCDQGSVSSKTAPAPNTSVDGVTIGGYEIGVRVMAGTSAPGCGLLLNGSTIQNGAVGVYAQGNGSSPVSVQLDSANTLQNLKIPGGPLAYNGGGLIVYSNVVGIVARDTVIDNADQGICVLEQGTTKVDVDIENNSISNLDNQAIGLAGSLVVTLLNNDVAGARPNRPATTDATTYGWGLTAGALAANVYPSIKARNNSFRSNGTAVYFGSSGYIVSASALAGLDFGTVDDPGNNTFQCSSGNEYAPDSVVLDFPRTVGASPVPFEGNLWDHTPPVSGQDFETDGVTSVTLDTANSTASDAGCL